MVAKLAWVALFCLVTTVAATLTSHACTKGEHQSGNAPTNLVSAPCRGWIVYADEFRDRQLVIINAGDGYHVMIAGWFTADVQAGQYVLAGEQVATMSGPRTPYVEFRKDGKRINPN